MKKTHVDGFLKGSNPASQGGITICDEEDCESFFIEQNNLTNNQVEIIACIMGMLKRRKLIVSDSQIAVNCLNGKWKSREEKLQPLVNLGKLILKERKKKLVWKKREKNLAGIHNEEIKETLF